MAVASARAATRPAAPADRWMIVRDPTGRLRPQASDPDVTAETMPALPGLFSLVVL